MSEVLEGTVRAWGGSLALLIPAGEARRLGLRAGHRVHWRLVDRPAPVELGEPPFVDDEPDASERHDELLYGA